MKNLRKILVLGFCATISLATVNAVANESGTSADKKPKPGSTMGSDMPCREFPLCSSKFQ
ncbi:hypothetical protein [Alteromonas ponticola]|uniref:Phosphate starvation-inducible protein PsiF n=1 Tax=Alteromonas ponticola TaxID=2720613 RepID=A0ABX1R243_9ALTE|nr:hypothetical protein [Alteromonas ponticola]NMH59828.1 hypothetical protein [Alteromonas ponticola]